MRSLVDSLVQMAGMKFKTRSSSAGIYNGVVGKWQIATIYRYESWNFKLYIVEKIISWQPHFLNQYEIDFTILHKNKKRIL